MWPEVPIKEVALGVFDGPHATPRRLDAGAAVYLGISSLDGGRIDLGKSDFVSEVDFAKWTRRVTPQRGDLVFSYETRLGEAATIPAGLRCCLGRRMGLVRPNPERMDSRYLLYAYLGPEFQEVLRRHTVQGSTVERILLTEFPDFPLRVPPLDEQRRIAAILGALDDKIELNRKMNQTLEAIARALFKSWFVGFDSNDDLVDSELGHIPQGWRWVPFAKVGNWVSGGTPSKKNPSYWEGGTIPWFSARSMGSTLLLDAEAHVTELGAENGTRLVPRGSVLFIVRGMSLAKELRIGLTTQPSTLNQDLKAIIDDGTAMPELVLMWMLCHREEIRSLGDEAGHGTKRLPTAVLHSFSLAVPPRDQQEAIMEPIVQLVRRIEVNKRESRSLAALRDTLLPKLISGELRVPDNIAEGPR